MLEYSFDRSVEPTQLEELFRKAPWAAKRNPDGIRRMLESTPLKVGAWEGNRLVGFARAITDGIYRALIDDVVVEPGRQGRGIGHRLVENLLDGLERVEEVHLLCGSDVVPFYERCGFTRGASTAMVFKRGTRTK